MQKLDSLDYKLNAETLRLIQEAVKTVPKVTTQKPHLIEDLVFILLFLYARRVGTDKEHIEFLSKEAGLDVLALTELLGAIDKAQLEIGE